MKKHRLLILLLITGFIMTLSVATQHYVENSVSEVEVFSIMPASMENVVVCSGTVEYSKKLTVEYNSDIVIKRCCANIGDVVEKGDLLFTATEASVETFAETPDISNISEDEIYAAIATGDISILEQLNGAASVSAQETTGKSVEIYSPYSGVITQMKYDNGEAVPDGNSLATISPPDALKVVLSVNESQIADIKVGQNVAITGTGFKNAEYKGVVESIAPSAKQTSSAFGKATTVEVTVTIRNADDRIKSGFTAKCSITVSEETDCLALPYEYINCDNSGVEYVLVYRDGFARKQYVKTGNEYMDGVQVLSGLTTSDRIIKEPTGLKQDARVELCGKAVLKHG